MNRILMDQTNLCTTKQNCLMVIYLHYTKKKKFLIKSYRRYLNHLNISLI